MERAVAIEMKSDGWWRQTETEIWKAKPIKMYEYIAKQDVERVSDS